MRVILRFQHLVLADIADGDRVAFGVAPQVVDDLRAEQRLSRVIAQDIAFAAVFLPVADLGHPLGMGLARDIRQQLVEHGTQITRDADIDFHALIEF